MLPGKIPEGQALWWREMRGEDLVELPTGSRPKLEYVATVLLRSGMITTSQGIWFGAAVGMVIAAMESP